MARERAKEAAPATDPAASQTKVWLGNRAAIEIIRDETAAAKMTDAEIAENGVPAHRRPIPVSKACSFYAVAPGVKLFDAATEITRSFWPNVSDDDAPAWVASTNPTLAGLLAEHWGGIEVREPEDPNVQHGEYVVDGGNAGKGA